MVYCRQEEGYESGTWTFGTLTPDPHFRVAIWFVCAAASTSPAWRATIELGNNPPRAMNRTPAVRIHLSRGKASAITVKPVFRLPRKMRANRRKTVTAFIAVAIGSNSPV
jgi:hypothetical protein